MLKKLLLTKFFLIFLSVQMFAFNFGNSQNQLPSFVEISKEFQPAVVNINTTKTLKKNFSNPFHNFRTPFSENDPFEDFFNKFFGNIPERKFKQQSLGSGFIISKDGYILTNNHVIENSDEINVSLSNKHTFTAKIIGTDPKTDIALIKIDPKGEDLKIVNLGDSDKLEIGEWVLAIGNPFGYSNTMTAGIVSAKGRVIGEGPYDSFIQTDAAINPGNSGGPLLNTKGEVVGINTAIIAGAQGIGFAIPINMAKDIINQLKSKGKVERGWLGVYIQKVTDDMAEYFNMKSPYGAMVSNVIEKSPADKAGIKRGDIIIEYDGKNIEDPNTLPTLVGNTPIGKEVKIAVMRKEHKEYFTVKIEKQKDEVASTGISPTAKFDKLGLYVSNITEEIKHRYDLKASQGVIVLDIQEGSIAEKSGIARGDIIKSIEYQVINNIDEYRQISNNLNKNKMLIDIQRGQGRIFFVLKIK